MSDPVVASSFIAAVASVVVALLGRWAGKQARTGARRGSVDAHREMLWDMSRTMLQDIESRMDRQAERLSEVEDELEHVRTDLLRERERTWGLRLAVEQLQSLVDRLRVAVVSLESQLVSLGEVPVTQSAGTPLLTGDRDTRLRPNPSVEQREGGGRPVL